MRASAWLRRRNLTRARGAQRTAMHFAGGNEVALVLADAGAALDAADRRARAHMRAHTHALTLARSHGRTPLHTCSDGEKVRLLVLRGADVHTRDAGGMSPLDWALALERWEVVATLRVMGGSRGAGAARRRRAFCSAVAAAVVVAAAVLR